MNLKKIDVNKDGEVETVWVLSQDQYYFLVNFAVNHFIKEGIATVETISKEDLETLKKQAMDEATKDYLVNADTTAMYKA